MTHTAQRTRDGRYAVVTPTGETLVVLCDEFAALTAAESLNKGPVRSVESKGRWTEQDKEAA